jgi:hypothetical protein
VVGREIAVLDWARHVRGRCKENAAGGVDPSGGRRSGLLAPVAPAILTARRP